MTAKWWNVLDCQWEPSFYVKGYMLILAIKFFDFSFNCGYAECFQATRQKCACPWDKLCQRFVGITFLQVCLGQSDRGFHALCVVLTKMRFMTMRFITMYFIILTWWKEFFSVQSTFDRSTAHQKLLYSVLSSLAEKWVISWK